METILVTGGAGFIGSHTCEAILKKGYRAVIIDSFNDYYNPAYKRENIKQIKKTRDELKLSKSFVKVYEGDIRDMELLKSIFAENDIDAVIHFAACAGVRPSIEAPLLYSEVNLIGTVHLLECMRKAGVKRHVFISSSSVYGNNRKVPFKEEDAVDHPISPYAATKKSGELLCYTYHHLYDIHTACLRFFTVYGPRQRPDLAIYKFVRLIEEEKELPFYGDGSMRRDYTYVTDTLDGVMRALEWTKSEKNAYEVFNLGNSNPVSLSDMVGTIEKITGKKAKLNRLPMQPGDVTVTYADCSKAQSVLGYEPKMPFEEGMAHFIDWMKKNRLG